MLEDSSGFSRARILLQRAGNGTSAQAGAGEADVPSSTDLEALVGALRARPELEVVAEHRIAARCGAFGHWSDRLDPRLLEALRRRDLHAPYLHQARALEAALDGRDVVIATGTASGKSLCFHVPIAHAALTDPTATALLLFPTKALARDQCASLRELAGELGPAARLGVATFDGDTPPDQRRAARTRARVVASNPDMLHQGVLPMHEGWGRFFAGLRFVVVDELHTYRGLFGSHVGNVLRRLWRVCALYGSAPQVIACSATIANPAELAAVLTGRPEPVCVTEDHAPVGPRTYLVVNPRIVDPVVGVRRDYLKVTRAVATEIRRAGVQSLVFCRTRKAVELLTRYLQDDERDDGGPLPGRASPTATIRGYRGGYLPDRRRDVEAALRSGEARMIATTNALELGIDVGGVDVVVLSGYPGSRAATLQRLGRAGRRGRASLGVVVLSSLPIDQFVAADPGFVFGQSVERAVADPDNPEVLCGHLRCAAQERPLEPGERWGQLSPAELSGAIAALIAGGALVQRGDGADEVVLSASGAPAAETVDLRGPIADNFEVVDDTGEILAEVAFEDGPLYLHPGAIHAIEGRTFEVRTLDWEGRKAYVRAVAADYYTEAVPKLRVRVIDPDAPALADRPPRAGVGEAHVVRSVPGFKKIRFDSHENIGFGPIQLPDLELHTRAAFWPVPGAALAALPPPLRAAATLAAGHALHHTAAMLLMCDASDLGHAITPGHPASFGGVFAGDRITADAVLATTAQPYVVLFDRSPGGAGLSVTAAAMGAGLMLRAHTAVGGCRCARGCPTCMGEVAGDLDLAQTLDRRAVLGLLGAMAAMLEGPT